MLNTILRIYILAIVSFWGVQISSARDTFYYYKKLGVKEGLSQSRVQSILNDYKGYLWIGTEAGLNCYDRDHLKQYFHRTDDQHSLPSNDITFIAEDSLHNLWVATHKGIALYDRCKDRFLPLTDNGKPVHVSSYLPVEGGMLFGGSGILYKYIYKEKKFGVLYATKDPSFFVPFWRMIRYDKETILLNSRWKGVYRYDLKKRTLEKANQFGEKNYTCMFFDSHKRLWLSSYGNGLFCYQQGRLIQHFTSENSPLSYNVIHDMAEKDNQLWVATDGGGINLINLEDFSFSHIRQQQDDISSFPANTIYRLYVDPADNMWAGSIRNGLIGIKKVYARSFRNVPYGNPYGLSNLTINCFFQDQEGKVWIGTDGGGLNRFDPETHLFTHCPTTKDEKVVSIVDYSREELLYSSFNKGLFLYHKRTGHIRPFQLMDPTMNAKTCVDGFSVYLQRTENDQILFSAQHIFLYDLRTRQFKIIASMGEDYERNSPLIVGTVGTKTYLNDLKNLCEYDTSTDTFRRIYQGKEIINDACIDEEGVFWLATCEGITRYDPHTEKSEQLRTNLFQEVTSLMSDHNNRIWIGTRRALYSYSTKNKTFTAMGEVDGVPANEYLFHSTFLTQKGDILMAGTEGMTLIDARIRFEREPDYSIELLDILLNGNSLTTESQSDNPSHIETIEVPWNFSQLQLKVVLNEKDVFHENVFRFQIEGFEEAPQLSASNSLVIRHLPEGEYTITGSYYTRTGQWSPKQTLVHLVVTPPWWHTQWFYLLLALFFSLLLYVVLLFFYRKKKRKQQEEIVQLEHRMYEEKINFLTNISHELRTPLTLICAPLKRILNKETDEASLTHLLESIYKQAYRMKGIIDMVLDVRKLEEGKEMLHILPHSLNDWVQSVGEKFNVEFEAKDIHLKYELDTSIQEVPFDGNKCEFVLSNFLMNALKFSDKHSTTTVTTSFSPEKDYVRVTVHDQGMGLQMVDANALFENFYQGNHDKGGSGIGLSYSKSLIHLHNGRIGASDDHGKGAIFYFELPIIPAKNQPVLSSDEPSNVVEVKEIDKLDTKYLKKYSVLIIEDATDLRNYLKETLKGYFDRVYVAKDGKDGLEQIRRRLPDIIISDVMMPRMNGFELCREVKSDLEISHIPFILLTAYHNAQNMYTGYKTGADFFLPKPFEVDTLLALIHNQLKLREQIRSRYKEDVVLTHEEISFSNADEAFLLKLNTIIADNISNTELDVNFLATNMCISRSLLFNKVKAITGMGIIDYVNKQRIDRSVVLLTTTTLNITEISEKVGFSSLRYFSKVFKSIKGEIPSTFRKQQEKEEKTEKDEKAEKADKKKKKTTE